MRPGSSNKSLKALSLPALLLLVLLLVKETSSKRGSIARDVGILMSLGCWKDTSMRSIRPVDCLLGGNYKKRHDAINKCARLADELGHTVLAIQNGGWCVSSRNAEATYQIYGPSDKCLLNGKGGPWANQVYLIEKIYADIGCWKDSMIVPPGARSVLGEKCRKQKKVIKKCDMLINMGCWKDTSKRAVPSVDSLLGGHYKKRKTAIKRCQRLATKLGNEVFAVQDGGWCATSKFAESTYTKYGPSTKCRVDGKGGPWANQVYKILCESVGNDSTTTQSLLPKS